MSDLSSLWEQMLQDPEFRAHCEEKQTQRDVADAILRGRAAQNLPREELAKLSGVSCQEISDYENEEQDIDVKTVERIAKALGCRVRITFELMHN